MAPPVPTGSQGARVPPSRARRTPVHLRMQSWNGQAVCLCDMEETMPWPTTPRWAQRHAPMASPPGLEHQATLTPHTQGPTLPASPRTPARARAHTHARTRTHPEGKASVVARPGPVNAVQPELCRRRTAPPRRPPWTVTTASPASATRTALGNQDYYEHRTPHASSPPCP